MLDGFNYPYTLNLTPNISSVMIWLYILFQIAELVFVLCRNY